MPAVGYGTNGASQTRSINGIRSYKRTADFLRENILNCNASKRVGTVSVPLLMVSKHAGIESPNAMKNVVPRGGYRILCWGGAYRDGIGGVPLRTCQGVWESAVSTIISAPNP